MRLAYLHGVEKFGDAAMTAGAAAMLARLRARWHGVCIASGGYDAGRAAQAITDRRADAVAFGRPFIANPDLPERIRRDAPLNAPDKDTFYGGGAEGYTDYPALGEAD